MGGKISHKKCRREVSRPRFQIDFGSTPIMMLKPQKTELRRRYEDGIWAQYRSAPHQLQLHAKVHRLQVRHVFSLLRLVMT